MRKILLFYSILENMRKYSAISRDLSSIALEEATFWVEHVARHGGADHLRPSTADTTLFQFFCLDIIAVILAFTLTIILLFYYLCKLLFRVFLGKSAKAKAAWFLLMNFNTLLSMSRRTLSYRTKRYCLNIRYWWRMLLPVGTSKKRDNTFLPFAVFFSFFFLTFRCFSITCITFMGNIAC